MDIRSKFSLRTAARVLLLAGVLVFALYLRRYTFWLPHWKGDQSHYITLAMKLDKLGFDQFNLRGVELRALTLSLTPQGKFAFRPGIDPAGITFIDPFLSRDTESKGHLLESLAMTGITYYDQPFFHKPTGLPYALALSHRIFTQKNQPYVVSLANIGSDLRKLDLRVVFGIMPAPEEMRVFYSVLPAIFQAQFWAVIVPLLFSMGLIFLTFMLGKYLFSFRTGLYAAFMMAINPVAIMSSQKIWADDMLAFFMTLAVILLAVSFKRGWYWPAFAGGLSCGVGVLAKQSSGGLLFALYYFTAFMILAGLINAKKLSGVKEQYPLAAKTVLFTIGVFAVSGFWFWKIYSMFGNPLWLPERRIAGAGGWSDFLSERVNPRIFFLFGAPYLCPLFIPLFLSIKRTLMEILNRIRGIKNGYFFIFFWMIILVFNYHFARGSEHRRLLPVYPLIAVISGYYFDKFRSLDLRSNNFFRNRYVREVLIVIVFASAALWSVPRGIEPGLEDRVFIRKPVPEWVSNVF
ncbi:MAG: phospholipid carrier-dependent glycosyltransferase [Candidatus Omnitrophota bacterium]